MGVLSDQELYAEMWQRSGGIVVSPTNADSVQPNSIDIRLGNELKISHPPYDGYVYRWHKEPPTDLYQNVDLTEGPYILQPKEFVLGVTLEYVEVPDTLACTIEGRSSIGRFGLFIVNAGRVDSGWKGRLTLEIYNAEQFNVELTGGMPIAQLVFNTITGRVQHPYGSADRRSKYQNDTEAQPSKLYLER